MPSQPPEDSQSPVDDTFSRRGLGKRLLLGASALAVTLAAGRHDTVQAAPTTPWVLGGNTIATNGTEYLGTKNVAPLIFKVTKTAGSAPTERMRITPGGTIGIGTTAPAALLHSKVNAAVPALLGENISTVANASGVLGRITSTAPGTNAAGVRGVSPNGTGVKGEGYIAVHGVGGPYGMYSYGTTYGVYASSGTTGVYAYGPEVGVRGETNTGTGVRGVSYSDSYSASAIVGEALGENNTGVLGEANNGSSAYGVWGKSTGGYAGYFSGKVHVLGNLSKASGSFKIDHPLHPDTKYLYHSFVESPDMMNVYNGNVTTDAKGEASVELPAYFEALNRDFRYQLTTIGGYAPVYIAEKIKGNRFKIAGGTPNLEVSWQVTGIRQDAFANANRIPVEEDKPAEERGKYLHPKEHGKPETAGVNAERIARMHAKNPQRDRPARGPQQTPPSNE